MSTGQYIALCTEEERVVAVKAAWSNGFRQWQPYITEAFHFGDTDDNITLGISPKIFNEIAALKPKVDDVVALLTFLFLQSSESQHLDMFERFLAANLGKGKIVHFWSE
jgi:hypothetical protein